MSTLSRRTRKWVGTTNPGSRGVAFGRATAQDELDAWVASHNTQRPHSALDMATPADRFTVTDPGRPVETSALLDARSGDDWISRKMTKSRIAEVDRAVLVAVSGNAVVGFVDASLQRHEGGGTYHRTGIDVYVEELIVTASQRRRGVGAVLMRAIEAWGRDAEARMIWLDTHLTNAAARGLYRAIGYREVGVELVKEL